MEKPEDYLYCKIKPIKLIALVVRREHTIHGYEENYDLLHKETGKVLYNVPGEIVNICDV